MDLCFYGSLIRQREKSLTSMAISCRPISAIKTDTVTIGKTRRITARDVMARFFVLGTQQYHIALTNRKYTPILCTIAQIPLNY